MPDEEVIEERRLKIQVKVKRKKKENRKNKDNGSIKEGDGDPPGIANLEDDTANTWNHYCQVSQDQQAMKVVDQNQSVEKLKAISTKFKGNEAEKFKGKTLRTVMGCSIKCEQ